MIRGDDHHDERVYGPCAQTPPDMGSEGQSQAETGRNRQAQAGTVKQLLKRGPDRVGRAELGDASLEFSIVIFSMLRQPLLRRR